MPPSLALFVAISEAPLETDSAYSLSAPGPALRFSMEPTVPIDVGIELVREVEEYHSTRQATHTIRGLRVARQRSLDFVKLSLQNISELA